MEPDRPCVFFFQLVAKVAETIAEIWRWVPSFVRWCGGYNPCIWWCLCCNVWGCWIVGILIALVVTLLLINVIVFGVIMIVLCFIVCFIFVVLNANSRIQLPNCAAYQPVPPPPPPEPPAPPPTDDTPDQ